MTYSRCCSHWLSQAVLPVKGSLGTAPESSSMLKDRKEHSTHMKPGMMLWALIFGGRQFTAPLRLLSAPECSCFTSATEDFPAWLWALAIGSSRKDCQALWRCCKLGGIPQSCPVSIRNCISWCLGTPAAQFEQAVPTGCVAGGRLDAFSAQVLPAVGQLCPGACAPSDRVEDAGWSAMLEMLTWAFGSSQLWPRVDRNDLSQHTRCSVRVTVAHKCLLAEVDYILISNLSSLFDKFHCSQSPQLGFDSSSLFTGILFFSYMPG